MKNYFFGALILFAVVSCTALVCHKIEELRIEIEAAGAICAADVVKKIEVSSPASSS